MGSEEQVRVTAVVRGRVQGVGFRFWTRRQGLELGLAGSARNLADGTVEVVAEGPRARVEELLQRLGGAAADRPGRVSGVTVRWEQAAGMGPGFDAV